MESDQFFPEYWPANKLIGILEGVLVKAEDIIGQLKNAQIESLEAPKITGQLTNAQIEEIAAAKIAGQLTSAQIESLAAAKIVGQLVDAQIKELTAGKIKGLLTNAQIEALDATKITGQLTNEQIKELQAAKIAGQISHAQIATEAITAINVAALAITAEKIAVEAITATKIAAGAVDVNKLAANSVIASKIAAEAVEASKIAALAVTTEKLAASAVTAGKIAANAITAEKILAEAVTAIKIAAGAISAEKIAAGAITAEKINVASLSAISANLGTVTAGVLKAVTIEGGKGSFTGKLTAEELDLTWAAALKEKIGSVRWLDVEGKVRSIITSSSIGSKTYSIIELETNLSEEEKFRAQLMMDVVSPSTGEKSANGLKFKFKTYPEKLIFGDTKPKTTLITQASDWLQLVETAKLKLQLVLVKYTWKAGTGASEVLTTKHSLEQVPQFAYAVGLFGAGGAVHAMRVTERNTTEIKTQINRNEAVAVETTLEFLMIIIG